MAKGGFPGGRMSGGMNMNMIKQAQKMQQDMLKKQEEIETREFSATAGGIVTAVVNGKRELLKLTIDPDAIVDCEDAEEAETISDAVLAAVNEALRKAADEMANSMSKLTGGLNLGF